MTMNRPQFDKEQLNRMGIASDAVPILTSSSLGVKIPRAKSQLAPAREISAEECIAKFGKNEAVEMNFIPQMLTALAMDQAEGFIEYCKEHRLAEYKKHNRQIRSCIEEYNRELRKSYGLAWTAYQRYLNRLRETVEFDLFKA